MTWQVEYTDKARKQLMKLDAGQRRIVLAWIDKNLEGCSNPRALGKPLKGPLSGAWRYRVGNYRPLCAIQDDRLLITALNVQHRSKVYRRPHNG